MTETIQFDFDLVKPKQFVSVAVDTDSPNTTIDPTALLMISNAVKKTVDKEIKEYYQNSEYKLDTLMKFDVAVNDTAIQTTRDKLLKYFTKEKMSKYQDLFLSKFKSLTAVS